MAASTILTVQEAAKRFGAETIFTGITFQINEREHIALVGANGAGKSTLLKIVAGLEEATEGELTFQTGLRVAYQAQEATFTADRSLYDEALDAFAHVRATAARMAEIEQEMTGAEGERLETLFSTLAFSG